MRLEINLWHGHLISAESVTGISKLFFRELTQHLRKLINYFRWEWQCFWIPVVLFTLELFYFWFVTQLQIRVVRAGKRVCSLLVYCSSLYSVLAFLFFISFPSYLIHCPQGSEDCSASICKLLDKYDSSHLNEKDLLLSHEIVSDRQTNELCYLTFYALTWSLLSRIMAAFVYISEVFMRQSGKQSTLSSVLGINFAVNEQHGSLTTFFCLWYCLAVGFLVIMIKPEIAKIW